MFTNFRNWGDDYIHTLNDGAFPTASHSRRRPNMVISSLALEGHHLFKSSELLWTGAVSRSRSAGGYGGANYSWVGDQNLNCHNDQSLATSVYRPGWAGCFGTGLDNVTDRNNYGFTELDIPTLGQSAELTLTGSADYSMQYHFGGHFDSVAFGFKIRNNHKYDNTYNTWWTTLAYSAGYAEPVVNGQTLQLNDGDYIPIAVSAHPEWDSSFSNPDYYDKTYPAGNYTDWAKVYEWVGKNQSQLVFHNDHDLTLPNASSDYSLASNYDLIERIPAGYVMNTFDFTGRVRLLMGVRFEATHVSTLSFDSSVTPTPTTLTYKAGGDYLNVMPDASLRFAIDSASDVRLVYSRGLSRPDPQDLTAALSETLNQTPIQVSLGNPALKAEMANDVDLLYERSLPHVGLLEAGYFYKNLTDPIATEQFYSTNTFPHITPGTRVQVSQPINAGSAWVTGFEISYQQRLSYLPGVMGGAGISANYGYTGSRADNLPGRSDSPRLLRDAPNVWNISPTYDTRNISMRVGMTFNDAMIYQYQWQDGADSVGVNGPSGDNYLYAHYQFDTQASYKLPKGFSVVGYGLNLNNEVFGFYNGSPKYMVQREYYHPTYAFGLRWDLHHE